MKFFYNETFFEVFVILFTMKFVNFCTMKFFNNKIRVVKKFHCKKMARADHFGQACATSSFEKKSFFDGENSVIFTKILEKFYCKGHMKD